MNHYSCPLNISISIKCVVVFENEELRNECLFMANNLNGHRLIRNFVVLQPIFLADQVDPFKIQSHGVISIPRVCYLKDR